MKKAEKKSENLKNFEMPEFYNEPYLKFLADKRKRSVNKIK